MKVKCNYCGKIFERKKSHVERAAHNYCSRECAVKGRGIANKGKNNPNWRGGSEVPCSYCGKKIWVCPYDLKGKTNHFCSRECSGKWRHENIKGENHPSWKGGKVKKTCEVCGKEFEVTPAIAEERKYCSRECASKAHGEEQRKENNSNWRGGKMVSCQVCGKMFWVVPAMQKLNARFCSNDCYHQWQSENIRGEKHPQWKPRVKRICEQCGKEFEVVQDRIKRGEGNFCSCSCARKARKIPTHHTQIEVILKQIVEKHTDIIKYTGDGNFWIKTPEMNINPDFIAIDKKIAIEANGDYWHSPLLNRRMKKRGDVNYRRKLLKKVGWKMIVFWETDLLRDDVEAFVLNVLKKEKVI